MATKTTTLEKTTSEPTTAAPKASVPQATAPKPRIFVYNGAELEDPDPSLGEKDVKKFYEQMYPELTTANLSLSVEKREGVDTNVWTFKKAAGTKG